MVAVDLPEAADTASMGQFQTDASAEQAAGHLRRALDTDPFIIRDDSAGPFVGSP